MMRMGDAVSAIVRSDQNTSLDIAWVIANMNLNASAGARHIIKLNSPTICFVMPDVTVVLSGRNAAYVVAVPEPSQF